MSRTTVHPVQPPTATKYRYRASLWASFAALMRWQLLQVGTMLPLIVVVQAMLAAGIVIGFGFIIPDITDATALFLSKGRRQCCY